MISMNMITIVTIIVTCTGSPICWNIVSASLSALGTQWSSYPGTSSPSSATDKTLSLPHYLPLERNLTILTLVDRWQWSKWASTPHTISVVFFVSLSIKIITTSMLFIVPIMYIVQGDHHFDQSQHQHHICCASRACWSKLPSLPLSLSHKVIRAVIKMSIRDQHYKRTQYLRIWWSWSLRPYSSKLS